MKLSSSGDAYFTHDNIEMTNTKDEIESIASPTKEQLEKITSEHLEEGILKLESSEDLSSIDISPKHRRNSSAPHVNLVKQIEELKLHEDEGIYIRNLLL